MFILEDILLENEPLALADKLAEIDAPFTTLVISDESVKPGATVFFGVSLPIGDIGDVRARVMACESSHDSTFRITLEITATDTRYGYLLEKVLKGEKVSDDPDMPDAPERPLWGFGLRQTNGTFATLVNCPAGLLNAEQLARLAEISQKGAGVAKLTHAQRVILLLKSEQLDTVREELAAVGLNIGVLHHGIRNIRACCGALCSFSPGLDGLGLALEIDKALFGRAARFDVKIAVSDCSRNCMESFCVDMGLVGDDGAYDVLVGGVGSSVHFKGLRLVSRVPPENVISLLEQILRWYEDTAQENERLYLTLERLGYAEAQAKKDVFAETAAMFERMDTGDDMFSRFERTLARSYGLLEMRKALEIGN